MKLNYYIYSLIASVMLIFSACSPDEYDLGDKGVTSDDLVEGIAYTITHDSKNPNIVYLESKLGVNYTALWEHPQGRSQEQKVTLKMPFEGTYTVKFGVETRGGVIYGEPTTFDISTFCADFVNDELWSFLTGGVDSEKVWIFDDGSYGYAAGEMTYADPSKTTTTCKPSIVKFCSIGNSTSWSNIAWTRCPVECYIHIVCSFIAILLNKTNDSIYTCFFCEKFISVISSYCPLQYFCHMAFRISSCFRNYPNLLRNFYCICTCPSELLCIAIRSVKFVSIFKLFLRNIKFS